MAEKAQPLVRLETGDRLTRDEFHRRYCARPDIRRAELVQGVVYVASPMHYRQHDQPNLMATGWLFAYALTAPGVRQGSGGTIFLDVDSEVQPDAFLFRDPPSWPGGIRHTDDDYLEGAPELVVEVAASSQSVDLNQKLDAYRRAGVREYIVWSTHRRRIIWLHLRDGDYVPLEPDERGVIESRAFPGLRLHVEKMLAGDMPGVLAELRPP